MNEKVGEGRRDRSRYEGKRLLWLLVWLGTPAAVLYFALAIAVVAGESPMTAERSAALLRVSNGCVFLFGGVQLLAAVLIYRQVGRPVKTRLQAGAQFVGVAMVCTCFSIVAAMVFEAFGLAMLARVLQHRL